MHAKQFFVLIYLFRLKLWQCGGVDKFCLNWIYYIIFNYKKETYEQAYLTNGKIVINC